MKPDRKMPHRWFKAAADSGEPQAFIESVI